MRRPALLSLATLALFAGVLVFVYHPVLLWDRQFVGGNSAYFDYPLFRRIQREWGTGRLPLWNPAQNGGAPLLGNPMAAVLYPGKLLYAIFSFAWATRLLVIAHTALAYFGVAALCRGLEVSKAGSALGGFAYALGAMMLCQHANTNLMIGAACVPWGLYAIDLVLRHASRRAVAGLAVVLALQTLGGDPQAAYLIVFCGAGYAVLLEAEKRGIPSWIRSWLAPLAIVIAWLAGTFALARIRSALPGFRLANGLVLAGWMAAGLAVLWRWRSGKDKGLARMLISLAGASALALGLSAVQVLPVLEFTGKSWRAEGISPEEIFRYSLHPCRVAELIWPNVFGTSSGINRSWLQAVPVAGGHDIWIESLYMGGFTLALALVGAGRKTGAPAPGRVLFVAIVLGGMAASLGKYASPLWWSGWEANARPPQVPASAPPGLSHGFRGDGFGSPYGMLATLLPGFRTFRYPTKIVIFPAVGLAVLAGMGWDRVLEAAESARRLRRIGLAGAIISATALAGAVVARDGAVAALAGRIPLDVMLGPADASGAWSETERALGHGALIFGSAAAVASLAMRGRRYVAVVALAVMAGDLAVANGRLIATVPQVELDEPTEVARLIEAAEKTQPSAGPFRIHRMPGGWFPGHFATTRSANRNRELIDWARETLLPLYALPLKLDYCATSGSLELEDYLAFFDATMIPAPSALAQALSIPPGQPIVYYPRRSYDLWGTRYFILPAWPDWGTLDRGVASFLEKTELIHPSAEELHQRRGRSGEEPWVLRKDWQLRRNLAAYPRAWLVHYARIRPPAADAETRAGLMRSLTFMNDAIWREKDRTVLDLRQIALIETDDEERIQRFLSPTEVDASESVTIVKHEPARVEIKAVLSRPGLVILADTYYPGWRLTIDGEPAPIYRANRLMRGAAVLAGEHTLVYTYEPASFRFGAAISVGGVIFLLFLTIRQRVPRLFHRDEH